MLRSRSLFDTTSAIVVLFRVHKFEVDKKNNTCHWRPCLLNILVIVTFSAERSFYKEGLTADILSLSKALLLFFCCCPRLVFSDPNSTGRSYHLTTNHIKVVH